MSLKPELPCLAIARLNVQGSKRRWDTRAYLRSVRHTISSQTSGDSTMDRAGEERLGLGSYDVYLRRNADLLPDVR